MNLKPIVLITGATGAQGGSVARALLKSGEYVVRIFTRNGESEKARALELLGAEIFTGDLDDISSLKVAMQDAYAVFGLTNYWEHEEREFQHGKNLVDTVRELGIWHFVFSTQANYSRLSHDQIPVPQQDIKAALETYARSQNVPVTFVRMSFYYENFLELFPLQEDGSGLLEIGLPLGNSALPMASVEDLGGIVTTILDHPREYLGRTVSVIAESRTGREYADIMMRVLRRPVHYRHIPREEFAALDFPNANQWANLFEVQRLYIKPKKIDLIESYGLYPDLQGFESWLRKNRNKILVRKAETRKMYIY